MSYMMTRDDIYDALRESLWDFACEIKSGDLGQVAKDMELVGVVSWDASYKVHFDDYFPDAQYPRDVAHRLVARFVQLLLVETHHFDEAEQFAIAIMRASEDTGYRPAYLQRWFSA